MLSETKMEERLRGEPKCPFCDFVCTGDERVVHCSNMGCPLNRVDFTLKQWRTRPLENVLVEDNDELRVALQRSTQALVRTGERLRKLEEQTRAAAEARRIAWMKKRHAAVRRDTARMRQAGG